MRKLLLIVSFLVLTCGSLFAQSRTITGTVIGDDGLPVPGASVVVKGTTTGTITDMDGKYKLNVPADADVLVFRFIGMQDKEMQIAGATVLDATLESSSLEIEEVVAIAYGTVKKSSFSGSAAQVNGEKLQKMQVSNISKGLDGAVAGLQIASSTGTPGSSASIRIRGVGSISSSQEPLIVVDGVPYEGSLNSISPQDIEALTVLKDAAANSMYGARGSNGVIIVTTKGSRSSKPTFNFEARCGFNARAVGNYDIVSDAGEYYLLMFESIRNSLVEEKGSYAAAAEFASKNLISSYLKYNKFAGVADDAVVDASGKLNPNAKKYKWNDDWTEDPFENGLRQEYNLNVTGGNETTQAYASLGYLSDEGYMAGSKFDRISGRVKVDQKVGEHVKFGGSMAYANTKQRVFGDEGSNYSNIFMFSQSIAPIYPIYLYDEAGKKVVDPKTGKVKYDFGTENERPYGSQQNPYAVAQENLNEDITDNISTRGYVDINFLKDFKFTVNAAYDVFIDNEVDFTTPIGGDALSVGGRGYRYATRNGALNVNQLLSWNHNFDGLYNVSLLAGHETKNDKYKYFMGHMTNFAYDKNPDFSNATRYQDMNSYSTEYALEGMFLKGDYTMFDKYFLTASIRRDGSSRFHKDNRWGNFWAVGASWKVNSEEFMSDLDFINFLKLKASYGTQGNDNVGYTHVYSDLYVVERVDNNAAFTKNMRGNKDLTWEKSNNFNVGFESRLFQMVTLNADFFIKETKDMLYQSPLATSEGAPTSIWRNEMDMKNTGFEVEVNVDVINTKDIHWTVGFNATHYKNELTKLPASKPASEYPDGYRAGSYWRKLGGSLYDFCLYHYEGVNPVDGTALYTKKNADGSLESVAGNTDATYLPTGKSAIPDLTGGISTNVEAYGFDLNVAASYQIGGWVQDSFYGALMNAGDQGHNFHKDMFKRWTPNNTKTNIPALSYGDRNKYSFGGDALLTKASYFNLRNVTLGYSLPKSLISKINVEHMRFYVSGDNIWLKSARKGLDPRQGFDGGTGYVYSAMSTYSVGLNLTF